MIDIAAVLTASVVCIAGVMSPGPNFVAVTHRSVTSHRAESLALVGGIVCVNALWATAALFGLGVVFSLFPWLFWSLKLLGAAYLVWFGVQLLHRSGVPLPAKTSLPSPSTCARISRRDRNQPVQPKVHGLLRLRVLCRRSSRHLDRDFVRHGPDGGSHCPSMVRRRCLGSVKRPCRPLLSQDKAGY